MVRRSLSNSLRLVITPDPRPPLAGNILLRLDRGIEIWTAEVSWAINVPGFLTKASLTRIFCVGTKSTVRVM